MANPADTTLIRWSALGVSRPLVERRFIPACERAGVPCQYVELPDRLDEPGRIEVEWDLLFVGYEIPGPGTLEAALRRLARTWPLQVLLAVAPAEGPEREVELLRAGALEVITPDSAPERIEQAMERAVAAIQSRRNQIEVIKRRLVNQLAISVNHEINNPLTGLMGTAELLLMESRGLDEHSRRDLQTILTQGRRIQEVTVRLKTIQALRTIPYGSHDVMLDLVGEMPPAQPSRAETPPEQFLPVPSVLVVDDNPLIIDLIERLFEGRFRIAAAACASDALTRLEERPYDLVLIDLILPEMNGLELYRAIRNMRPDQKAILTTAYQGDARVEQAIAEGALGCVYKPFQLEELERALGEALREPPPRR